MPKTLAERLTAARRAVFVGREIEQTRFQNLLLGNTPPGLLWLYGAAGIGKSALLREWQNFVRERELPTGFIEGRLIESNFEATPAGFLNALADAFYLPVSDGATQESILEVLLQYLGAKTRRVVIFIDNAEQLAPLETWWREEFFPALPENVFFILAGRTAPDSAWNADAGWRALVHIHALRPLSGADARLYLQRRDVPALQHSAILQFTHGHPLALALVADVFEQRQARGEEISLEFTPEDAPEVVRTLLNLLLNLGETELSGAQRAAVEACALVHLTTQDLLSALLDEDAHSAFLWLRDLSFIETGRQGLFPDDMAREVLLADLRWRNPGQHRLLHERARAFYGARFQQAELQSQPQEQLHILLDYIFLHRHNPMVRPFLDWRENSGVLNNALLVGPMRHEANEIVALVKQHEGKEAAALAKFWLTKQPENVTVLRDLHGQLSAFVLRVSLSQATIQEIERDPATEAAWDYIESHAPLRAGEEALFTRFWMARDSYQDISPAQSLIFVSTVRGYLTKPNLAFTFFACAAPEFYTPLFTYANATRLSEADFKIGGHDYGVFAHDWRTLPPLEWLNMLGEREVSSAPQYNAAVAPPIDVLTREVFFEAVRDALRDWHRPGVLCKNPLLRTRLVVNRAGRNAGDDERVVILRSLLREAMETMRNAKREGKFLRALYHGYLKPAATQERAAEAMSVPFSTYRRYLKSGLHALADSLWKREIGG